MAPRLYKTNPKRRLPGREPYVVTALRRKYGELKGRKDEAAMAHVGATLLLFNPTEDLVGIPAIRPYKPKRERWMRSVLEALRTADRPLTGRELTYAVMRKHGVSTSDLGRFKSIQCGLYAVLERLEGRGVVRASDGPKRWTLA